MSCPSSTADLTIYQGDDYAASFTVKNPDGTLANLSGFGAQAQLRRDYADNDSEIAATFTCVVSSPSISMSLPRTVTAALTGTYLWDLQLVGPTTKTIGSGKANVKQEVTR